MTRQRLPNRRYSETTNIIRGQIDFAITYGRDDQGDVREVFINAAKTGSEIEVIMNDAATALSIALQSGRTPAELYKSMRRDPSGKPTSAIGVILQDMVKVSTHRVIATSATRGDAG